MQAWCRSAICTKKKKRLSFKHSPLVSVILVTHNSSKHIFELGHSLKEQAYNNFELIVVDNASTDNTICLAKEWLGRIGKSVVIKELNENVGFAEGSNIGRDLSNGELIALLNADTIPDSEWLLELVNALKLNGWASVAAPKLVFVNYFKRLSLTFSCRVKLEIESLTCGLTYKKIIIRAGIKDQSGKYIESNKYGNITMDIPSSCSLLPLRVKFRDAADITNYMVDNSDCLTIKLETDVSHELFSLPVSYLISEELYYVRIPDNLPILR